MQSNAKNRVLFLEDWLRSAAASSSGAPAPPPPPAAISARSILQAWAELRDPSLPFSDPNPLVSALQILDAARFSLHIADPQAKLLISHLSSDQALPSDSLPLILRLLYFWLRKTPRASPSLLNSAASVLSHLFSARPHCPALLVLLLGALAATPSINVSCRRDCLDLLCLRLELARFEEELIAELLAGIGYSLSRSDDPYFSKLLSFLLRIGNGGSPSASVYHGLMILHLSEWLVTGFVNLTSLGKMESISGELSGPNWEGKSYSPFAVAMTSAGVLRALRMVPSKNRAISIIPDMRSSVENSITSVANHALLSDSNNASDGSHLLQCISIGVSRAGLLPFSAPLLMALNRALLTEIFPFAKFCRLSLEIQNENSINIVLEKLKGHLQSIIFKEAGAITSAFCHQYASADDTHKVFVESSVWNCSLEFYTNIRAVALLHRTKNDQLLGYLEKFGEAAFLMIVVYAAEVASQKLNPKSSHEIRPEVSVQILMAFSCIEYMRRVRLPEYTDVVRRAVLAMQEHAALCISFVESMPPYVELTNKQGLFTLEGARYVWFEDEVQTARMLFYLRVIPTCINLIPASVFGKLVAPTMFLYLQHPNEKVARASHSVFAALMSSGKDSDRDERLDLKEKLVFYYTQRALEAYPAITPFEGLASGVTALVRHVPAGSPAVFYCINRVAEKAIDLCKEAISVDMDMWRAWEGSSETCKKLLDMLMRLIYLVDIQRRLIVAVLTDGLCQHIKMVFPYLLKRLAEFILQLPRDGKKAMLGELYVQVAESDDVTRKPLLVSWLHSLSYLCEISPLNNGVPMNGTCGQNQLSAL